VASGRKGGTLDRFVLCPTTNLAIVTFSVALGLDQIPRGGPLRLLGPGHRHVFLQQHQTGNLLLAGELAVLLRLAGGNDEHFSTCRAGGA
jgi:hypothetical protein